MKKLLLWGQPLINRITRSGIIVATHNVTQPAPPPHIVDITQNAGTCTVVNTGTGCTATSTYTVQGQDFTPPVDIVWSVESPATIISGQGTVEITVQTNSNTATTTYDVTCTATDVGGTDTMTKTFSETRTVVPKITITDIVQQSGGSCEFPTSGTCQSVATFTATTTGGQGTKTYNWSANNGVVLTNANTPTVTATTPASSTNLTYDLTCVIGDETGSAQLTEQFTDSKTQQELVGETWTLRTHPSAFVRRAVCWGNGIYVSLSNATASTSCSTSPDGINWTTQTGIPAGEWSSVAYGLGLFVAVNSAGSGSPVMTSPDGINWTTQTGQPGEWRSISFASLGVFNAVASSGQAMQSLNGTTWTNVTTPAANNWRSVANGNGIFVAVAGSGTGNRVMSSTNNGSSWQIRTSSADNFWSGVAFGNGLFAAVSSAGVMTSPNGVTWTNRTCPANNWQQVTFTGTLFVAVSDNGTGNRVMTSPDGINWTSRTSAADNPWVGVCYSDTLNQCVAVSTSGANRIMTSP